MSDDDRTLVESVTLSEAKALIQCAAQEQSFLLLSAPGVGKSDMVNQAAAEAGLECRSLLGTQIAAEDVSGVPYIVGERSVFCPPRILLPESSKPFCLFLDELPACTPDIQKAFYSLLLERRLGEHALPPGTWVVAAGNRSQDRALVRTISSALVNRVVILEIRADVSEWLAWARRSGVRRDVIGFVQQDPAALSRPVVAPGAAFSTPRAWASLSRASIWSRVRAFSMTRSPGARRRTRLAGRRCSLLGMAQAGRTRDNPGRLTLEQNCTHEPARSRDATNRHPQPGQGADPAMASEQSLLILSSPGVGKSDVVRQAAAEAKLPFRSLLGTQIAPEDVSGIPRIVGERSVFCPPRVLLPEDPQPFCLFLDELPACAGYPKGILFAPLERGGRAPPPRGDLGCGGREPVRGPGLVPAISSALVNRVFLVHVRVDVKEWLIWAKANHVRSEILAFIAYMPGTLMKPVPRNPVPFSTPRPGRRCRDP